MKVQKLILAAVATYIGVGEAALCWTNGLNHLAGGRPWGAGCRQPPVNPPPPPPPVSCPTCPAIPPPSTITVTATVISTTTTTETSTTTTTETSTTTATTTTTSVTTSTSFGIHPATVMSASGVCMGLSPPRATPLFDAQGAPACCVPIVQGGVRVC